MSHHASRFTVNRARRRDLYRIVAEIGHHQILQQLPAVRVWICAHSPLTARSECGELRYQRAMFVEQLFRPVTLEPIAQDREMLRLLRESAQWNLMRAERAFGLFSIN